MKQAFQILIALLFCVFLIFCNKSIERNSNCITLFDNDNCFYFGDIGAKFLTSEGENTQCVDADFNFLKYSLESGSKTIALELDTLLEKSIRNRDSHIGFEIDLEKASYGQFVAIIDRFIKNKVNQIN